jgi:hypothetical protein
MLPETCLRDDAFVDWLLGGLYGIQLTSKDKKRAM